MNRSKHILLILLIVLILSATGCVRAALGHSIVLPTEPEIHERTIEGEYLDSVSFQTRIDIINWTYGGQTIAFALVYIAILMGVLVIRRKSSKVWHYIILALIVIFIFCENLNFHKVERFFMTSLNGSEQPITVVVKRSATSSFFPTSIRYQIEKTSTVIWTPFANLMVDQMIKQSDTR